MPQPKLPQIEEQDRIQGTLETLYEFMGDFIFRWQNLNREIDNLPPKLRLERKLQFLDLMISIANGLKDTTQEQTGESSRYHIQLIIFLKIIKNMQLRSENPLEA